MRIQYYYHMLETKEREGKNELDANSIQIQFYEPQNFAILTRIILSLWLLYTTYW